MGEVAKYRNGKAHENCIDESGKYIVVNSKFVSTNGTVIKHSNMQNEPLAQNEIAFVLSDVPNGRAIARTFLVEENDKYTLNQRIAGITSSENTYPYFLHILMNRHPYFLAFDDGVKQTNLSVSDVLNFETYYPEYEEQKQIGEYFRNLDRLITLHQRKCQIDGCRFQSPLAITWEQRKLGEVAKYRNGKAHENCIDESGKYIVVNSKFVSTNGTVIKHSNMQNEPLAQNEIAFVLSDVPNGRAIARTFLVEENDKYTLNQRIAGITSSENTYPYFLHILMNRHPYFLAFDDGVKQTNLSVSDVLNFETYYPEYEEQKQIGEYFRNLDRLITLHQCE